KNKRPLTSAELLALLEVTDNLVGADSIDAVNIPPPVDEVEDSEDIDDDGQIHCKNDLVDVAETYKIYSKIGEKSPYEVFSLYFSEDVWEAIVNYSKKYVNDHKRHNFALNKESLKRFFGILMSSGCHTPPLVRNCVSRNPFGSIKKNVHGT
ncbi:hypothetical protein ILUMI_19274, partial [Ignelater luminosus]